MRAIVDKRVASDFVGLELITIPLGDLAISRRRDDLEAFKTTVEQQVRSSGTADALKDDPMVRAYRDFFWKLGIDPTKIRPAAEALIRRIVRGRPLPTINTAVDAYNVASVETRVAFAAFDADALHGDLTLRYAKEGESFLGIAMDRPMVLEGNELVMDDGEELVAVYPYRDADASKLTEATTRVLLLGCGVPGIGGADLRNATERAAELITTYATR